eukprot:gene16126-22270_t
MALAANSRTTAFRSAAARPAVVPRAVRPVQAPRNRLVASAALKKGDVLSDFSEAYKILKTNTNDTVQLGNFKGKKPIVLFFYPKAATPGCTKEVCKFRDEYERFTKAGAVVFGISSDEPSVNDAFAKANNIKFPLLTDSSSILRKVFGIPGDFLGLLPGRQTYVFDKQGKCIMAFNDQLNAEQHVSEALSALNA